MAEIKIEKKKPIWPWILAALAVLLILYFVFTNDEEEAVESDPIEETQGLEQEEETVFETENEFGSTEVESYVTFVQTDSEDKMGLAHNYTSTALDRLVAAVKAKAEGHEVNIEDEMNRVTEVQNYITEDAYVEQHADSLKIAFQAVTEAIKSIQQAKEYNTSVDVAGLEQKANAIKGKELTLNQKNEVRAFFDKAAMVLKQMNDNEQQFEGQEEEVTSEV